MQQTHSNHRYTYDKSYRLTGATHPTLTNETFSYDKVGNRLSTQESSTPWVYNDSDQLLSTPEASYQYNLNGHTKSVDYSDTVLVDMAYDYDSRERLKQVFNTANGNEIQSNRYDYNNRRIAKDTVNGTTYFLYSPSGLEGEYEVGGDLIQGYLFGEDTYSTNPVLTYKPNSGGNLDYHYYHNDHLFTPQRLTDSSGIISWSADYSAFGETTITTETISNNLRFSGQYYDVEIKLSQNYFRDYNPSLGRYVESDPIGLDGGVNFYGYVRQNPIRLLDPMGLNPFGGYCPNGSCPSPIPPPPPVCVDKVCVRKCIERLDRLIDNLWDIALDDTSYIGCKFSKSPNFCELVQIMGYRFKIKQYEEKSILSQSLF